MAALLVVRCSSNGPAALALPSHRGRIRPLIAIFYTEEELGGKRAGKLQTRTRSQGAALTGRLIPTGANDLNLHAPNDEMFVEAGQNS